MELKKGQHALQYSAQFNDRPKAKRNHILNAHYNPKNKKINFEDIFSTRILYRN